MAEHENSIGATSDWYTPPEIFNALGLVFDLDPCSPGPGHWVPARRIYTEADDGLRQPWHGLVFMNPPFGGRNGHVPWLAKFLDHGNGIAIVRAYTSSAWFHEYVVPRAELLLFPKGKTKFIRPDGSVGAAPGHGVVLLGMGDIACTALRKSRLGFCAVITEPERVLSMQPSAHCRPRRSPSSSEPSASCRRICRAETRSVFREKINMTKLSLTARAVKVTIPLDATAIAMLPVPDQQRVELAVGCDGLKYIANIATKSLR